MREKTKGREQLNNLINILQENNNDSKEKRIIEFLKNIPRIPHNKLIKDEIDFPSKVILDVNSSCNLNCKMCYIKKRNQVQISYKKILKILDEIKNNKPNSIISYSSLEPFLRNDFLKIIKKTSELNIPFSIFTNGTLIDEKMAKSLVKYKPISITFSLHGLKDTHEEINGVPGSYDKVISAIKNINHYKKIMGERLPFLRSNCVISSINYRELLEYVKIGNKLDLDMRFSHLIWEDLETHLEAVSFLRKNLGVNCKDIRINFNNKLSKKIIVTELIEIIKKIKKEKNVKFLPDLNAEQILKWYTSPKFFKENKCFYPFESMNIRSNGEAYPCAFIDYSYGNILKSTIKQIWNSERAHFFKKLLKKKGVILSCNKCCKL